LRLKSLAIALKISMSRANLTSAELAKLVDEQLSQQQ
jgi:hypothetical protein